MNPLTITPIQTDILHPGDSLSQFIFKHIKKLPESSILAITSKIVSISEKTIVQKSMITKADLVKKESDQYLGEIGYGVHLSIKHGLLIPSAGIDESNTEGDYYILYPQRPYHSAQLLWKTLTHHYKVKNLGILITDSHTHALRRGVTGIGLSYWGFEGTKNLIGEKDLFGREFKMTHVNYVDGLSAAAVLMMGEGTSAHPLALIENAPVVFTDKVIDPKEIEISIKDDLYAPLIQSLLNRKT